VIQKIFSPPKNLQNKTTQTHVPNFETKLKHITKLYQRKASFGTSKSPKVI